MRQSQKTVVVRQQSNDQYISADFVKGEFDGSMRDKGYDVIHEKAYMCPCSSRPSNSPLNVCKNCGGTGYIFANPTKTKMIVTSIQMDSKLKEAALREWGNVDLGTVKITANNEDKLSYMDRVTILDATAEHNQVLQLDLTDDEANQFAYTKYDIINIDFVGLFEGPEAKLKRLVEFTDYTFRDNILILDPSYNDLTRPVLTIRYIHHPSFHVTDILRESITSTKDQGVTKMTLPVAALAKRAHLIADAENFDGDRLFDNSWKPTVCDEEEFTKLQRQLRYSTPQFIYDNLTTTQRAELHALLGG